MEQLITLGVLVIFIGVAIVIIGSLLGAGKAKTLRSLSVASSGQSRSASPTTSRCSTWS